MPGVEMRQFYYFIKVRNYGESEGIDNHLECCNESEELGDAIIENIV